MMVHTKLKLAKALHRFSYIGFSNVEKVATGSKVNVVLSEQAGGQELQEIGTGSGKK
jgi:hypothetical protein